MATFSNGESGLSVRTKINDVLQHADGTAGELVINEAGADVDFRVESDTSTHALFMDGASGNIGIGVVPSAWGTAYKAIQVGETPSLFGAYTQVSLASNHYIDNSFVQRYVAAGAASHYQQVSGTHSWFTAPSGTAGNAITFTQAMTLNSDGNLAIGLTNPGTARLCVKGTGGTTLEAGDTTATSGSSTLRILGDTTGNFRELSFGVDNTAGYTWQRSFQQGVGAAAHAWFNWNTQSMTLDAGGNLGVGTTSPTNFGANYTTVQANGRATTAGGVFRTSNSNASAVGDFLVDASTVTLRSATNVPLTFQINSIERVRIDASGNVGIGTLSPTQRLDVYADSARFSTITARNTVSGLNFAVSGDGAALVTQTGAYPLLLSTSNTERMRIDASGNLLIGTSASGASKLRISGLPTSSAGLSAGDVWNSSGTLRIV